MQFYKKNLFTQLTIILVLLMPLYVLTAVFLENVLHIPKAGFFIKELLLIAITGSLAFEYYKDKKLPKFDLIDYLVFSFIAYGVAITFVNGLGLKSILYGGRYDFMFLIVMLIYKHSSSYLHIAKKELMKLFLLSGSVSLFLGLVFKFTMKEEYLLNFGFTNYVGNWIYSGGVPNYHGLEGTGIRRFQGVFDGPNPMAYFLIVFSGIFLYLQEKKNEYYVWLFSLIMIFLLYMTYSRSAFLGIIVSCGVLILLNFKNFYTNHLKVFLTSTIVLLIIAGSSVFLFQDTLKSIVLRQGSTTGHFHRMAIGIERFTQKPFGAGLAESGPAYRSIYPEHQTAKDEEKYIPESWYIQLLTEGGLIYLGLFIAILIIILKKLYKESPVLFAMALAVFVMNIFLHIFEATYISILLFLFIGLFLKKDYTKRVQ